MNPELLDKVLNCRDLPTLPAVAMRVVELTNSERVSTKELGDTIQNDQALSAKVLRTVNSSMFGLRTKCSNINQAIVMLGLATVKTLALGFSLVGAISKCKPGGFDMVDHWRRSLHTAMAGRIIATKADYPNPDEAFLGGLLQDVGMIAMVQALGDEYLRVIAPAQGDHRKVCKLELDALEIQHPDVGAMLARKWKLPDTLVMPIKYHERATAAPIEHTKLCRAVGLGNIASDVLTATEPAKPLRKFYERAELWFGLSSLQADDLLKLIAAQAKEMASLLSVPTGEAASPELILEKARKQLSEVDVAPEQPAQTDLNLNDPDGIDELTGTLNRARLEQALLGAFEQTRGGVGQLAVGLVEIDGLDKIIGQYGPDAGDSSLIWVATRLERVFRPLGGIVARYSDARFAVLVSRADRASVLKAAEQVRGIIAAEPVQLIAASRGSPPQISLTCSVGMAAVDKVSIQRFETASELLGVVEQAVQAAKNAGQNAVRVYAPTVAAAA